MNSLRETLARLRTLLWGRRAPITMKTEDDANCRSRAEARARFWSEFREGQREAEANSSRAR